MLLSSLRVAPSVVSAAVVSRPVAAAAASTSATALSKAPAKPAAAGAAAAAAAAAKGAKASKATAGKKSAAQAAAAAATAATAAAVVQTPFKPSKLGWFDPARQTLIDAVKSSPAAPSSTTSTAATTPTAPSKQTDKKLSASAVARREASTTIWPAALNAIPRGAPQTSQRVLSAPNRADYRNPVTYTDSVNHNPYISAKQVKELHASLVGKFSVAPTTSRELPVYAKFASARSRTSTYVRRVSGDVRAFARFLSAALQVPANYVQLHPTANETVIVKGHFVEQVKRVLSVIAQPQPSAKPQPSV
ncbi:hypothetical protein CAOG_04948 [Capsaspora owczarzaki ATCC 30864]|uniref:Uncharacterized protein n=1 Tax=Capsaspora owczarzaki (strain ATCC 30864) TaxID=595528 RepID=A0A0D2WR18_CAPO3|nr:hypothetical protein CAOG_04948 [Capsaspora owczarzaki ATCC 30864]KJE94280.1 hypothetical protein CAOG_004948 [Capsaspora owczarzaki ATCC 30864]|eukprot:XP_004347699.1 hypothetical protein CAOG_04948 [Capsaspora owczarzaki ATCC 30864]